MYGRHPFPLPTDEEEKTGIVRSREVVRDLWTVFNRTVPKAVLAMREDAQDRAYYPHKTGHFRVGDTVYCMRKRVRKNEDAYDGPYRVVTVLGRGLFKLQLCDNPSVVRTEPTNHLKMAAAPEEIGRTGRAVSPTAEEQSMPVTPTRHGATPLTRPRRYFTVSPISGKRKRGNVDSWTCTA